MSTRHAIALLIFASSSMLLAPACGPDEPASSSYTVTEGDGGETAYDDGTDVIVAPGRTGDDQFVVSGEPADGECVQIDDATCVSIDEAKGRYCDQDGAQADIILDENGEVIEVICYPPPSSGAPLEEVAVGEDGSAQVPQNQSGAVIIFDEATDGEPLEGDVTLDAERTSLFGNGVDETILDGNLAIASNNSRTRGLTVTGDVTVAKNSNNNALAFCKILGSLSTEGNGLSVVNCQVFGDVSILGNDARLVNIGVQGEWDVNSKSQCHGCYSFSDEDEDGLVVEEELGEELLCGE